MSVQHFKDYFNEDFQVFKSTVLFDFESINKKIKEGIYCFENNIPDNMMQFLKDDKILYDIETMRKILNVSKSKLQRELKKQAIT